MDIDETRALARAIYEGWSSPARASAQREIASLSGEALDMISDLLRFRFGRPIDMRDVVWDIEHTKDKAALRHAMIPLLEYWERENGAIGSSVYSNQKKTDKSADDGASPGLRWLAAEMTKVTGGPRMSPVTARTIFRKIKSD